MATKVRQLRNREGEDSPFGAVVSRNYQVIGPTTETTAFIAVDDTSGLAIPQRNIFGGDVLAENPVLRVFSRSCTWADYSAEYGDVWTIRVEYRAPQFDIVAASVEWVWDQQVITRTVTGDINGNPYLNFAGDPLIGSQNREIISPVLRVWFNGIFSPTLAYAVSNRINSADVTLFSGTSDQVVVPADSMRCMYFHPTAPQRVAGETVRIEAAFDFLDGVEPWQLHLLNAGFNSWHFHSTTSALTKGRIHTGGAGAKETEDAVLLDLFGRPLPTTFTVGDAAATPVAAPSEVSPTWAGVNELDIGYELIFDERSSYDFRGFIPPVM